MHSDELPHCMHSDELPHCMHADELLHGMHADELPRHTQEELSRVRGEAAREQQALRGQLQAKEAQFAERERALQARAQEQAEAQQQLLLANRERLQRELERKERELVEQQAAQQAAREQATAEVARLSAQLASAEAEGAAHAHEAEALRRALREAEARERAVAQGSDAASPEQSELLRGIEQLKTQMQANQRATDANTAQLQSLHAKMDQVHACEDGPEAGVVPDDP